MRIELRGFAGKNYGCFVSNFTHSLTAQSITEGGTPCGTAFSTMCRSVEHDRGARPFRTPGLRAGASGASGA